MQSNSANPLVAAILLGVVSLGFAAPTDPLYSNDVGTVKWFETMRNAGANSAMLKALAGSNGQAIVPADCVEIAGVITFLRGNPFAKGTLPGLRIVSVNDMYDNVPRSPYIYQSKTDLPNFYSVLKRDLPYTFVWMDQAGREQRCATWQVPPSASKQLRLVFAVDPAGACKITQFGDVRATK